MLLRDNLPYCVKPFPDMKKAAARNMGDGLCLLRQYRCVLNA